MAGKGRELGAASSSELGSAREVETRFVVDSTDGCVVGSSSEYSGLECSENGQTRLAEVSSRRRRPPTSNGDGGGAGGGGEVLQVSEDSRTQNSGGGVSRIERRMGGCGRCGKKCEGFLTDREQRKVWGIGILYVLGFPLLLLMTVVGGLKVSWLTCIV